MNYKEVYKIITEKLEEGIPHLTLRIGDGEGMCISHNKREYVFKRQLGFVPTEKDMDNIGELVADAYVNSNIIGIPTEHHIKNCGSYWAQTYNSLKEARSCIEKIPTASIDLHLELLKSGLLHKLLHKQDDLIYVSGRNLDDQFRKVFNIKNVESFIVTPEQFFQKRKSQTFYPFQFQMCQEWIDKTDIQGKLCLTGTGLLGKPLARLLKKNGGIVLDIGSVFDLLAGLKTRGRGKGIGMVDETYKL